MKISPTVEAEIENRGAQVVWVNDDESGGKGEGKMKIFMFLAAALFTINAIAATPENGWR